MGRDLQDANARCNIPRPDYVREADPGTPAFPSVPVMSEPDPRIAMHNRELLARLDGRGVRPPKER